MISKLNTQTVVIFSAIMILFLTTSAQCQGPIPTLIIDGPGGYLPDDIGIQADGPNGVQAQFRSENHLGDVVITRKVTIYGTPLQAYSQGPGLEDTLPEASLSEACDLLDEGFKKAVIIKDVHPSGCWPVSGGALQSQKPS